MGRSLPHPTGACVSIEGPPSTFAESTGGCAAVRRRKHGDGDGAHPVTEGLRDPTVLSPSDRAGKGRLATGRDREGE